MSVLICPVCGRPLEREEKTMRCFAGHSFDLAREGYVNLLSGGHKPGDQTGDSRAMALARRSFLNRQYFRALHDAVTDFAQPRRGRILDICCGEGYYSDALTGEGRKIYAFDLSREMVRLAAKRKTAECFVANIASIPLQSGSMDFAIHLFAPFHDVQFSRILREGGELLTVVPGRRHLMGMKEVLYSATYENDEQPPECSSFAVTDCRHVCDTVTLRTQEDIAALLNMTPYGVHSPREGVERLLSLNSLTTELDFVLYTLQKK